jgi:hypothetical protein
MFVTLCEQIDGDCTSILTINDYVLTPDGPGTIEALYELDGRVRLDEEMDGAPIRCSYPLDSLHLNCYLDTY